MRSINVLPTTNYTDIESVYDEIERAKIFCRRNGWRIIDVTGKAVEENAARIIEYHEMSKGE